MNGVRRACAVGSGSENVMLLGAGNSGETTKVTGMVRHRDPPTQKSGGMYVTGRNAGMSQAAGEGKVEPRWGIDRISAGTHNMGNVACM